LKACTAALETMAMDFIVSRRTGEYFDLFPLKSFRKLKNA